jgi:BlaI family transcriptional regulator, penicillinase repressor
MSDPLPALTEPQLALVSRIWDRGEATVAELVADLAATGRPLARNTVQTTVQRLEEKGWLRHRDERGVFIYQVTRPRAAAQAEMAGRLVDGAFAGRIDDLVQTLVRDRGLDAATLERLRALIDQTPPAPLAAVAAAAGKARP